MAKRNKHADDSGRTRRRSYYDPAVSPYPPRPVVSVNPGPVGNSRQQRRQRARLSFAEQWLLARSMGFEIPKDSREILTVAGAEHWIAEWEKAYARL